MSVSVRKLGSNWIVLKSIHFTDAFSCPWITLAHVSYPLVHHTTLTKLWGNRGWQNSSSLQDPFDLLILTICQHHSLMQWLSLCVDCPTCVKTQPYWNTEDVTTSFLNERPVFALHMGRIIQLLISDMLGSGIVFLVVQKKFGHSILPLTSLAAFQIKSSIRITWTW